MNHPYPKGTRVRKTNSEESDAHPDGSLGTITNPNVDIQKLVQGGSDYYFATDVHDGRGTVYFYFVDWDSGIPFPVGVLGSKLEAIHEKTTAGAQ